ncbi:hypothetical protein AAG906_039049 [Vitis piasezkii]
MVEELRNLLQRWFSNHEQQALSMKTELTTWADMELHLRFNKSSGYENSLIYSYSKSIYPTGNNKDWVIPENIRCRVVLPPKSQRPVGKPRNERICSGGEAKCTRCCGRCDEHSCVNIVENKINIQEFSLQPVHQSL